MNRPWRIIDTGPKDPFTNMAFDEALVHGYGRSAIPTLRLYGWKTPSLSVGYSQDPRRELDIEVCHKNAVPFVRRMTGGGIILHNAEITYSLVCAKDDLGIPPRVVSSYKTICSFLLEFYKRSGLTACFACDAGAGGELGKPSALCFAAHEKYDIVIGGRKIGGNAQKRVKNVIFQHGSIPLRVDIGAASSFLRDKTVTVDSRMATGLEDLLGCSVDVRTFTGVLIESFTKSFNVDAKNARMTGYEEEVFAGLKSVKYESDDWNLDRIDNSDISRRNDGSV